MFNGALSLDLSLTAMIGMVADLEVNKKAMKQAADLGYVTTTDFADWLVSALGITFREAHHITERAVALAERKQCRLQDLSFDKLQAICFGINMALFDVLTVEKSVENRKNFWGTAPAKILR